MFHVCGLSLLGMSLLINVCVGFFFFLNHYYLTVTLRLVWVSVLMSRSFNGCREILQDRWLHRFLKKIPSSESHRQQGRKRRARRGSGCSYVLSRPQMESCCNWIPEGCSLLGGNRQRYCRRKERKKERLVIFIRTLRYKTGVIKSAADTLGCPPVRPT